MKKRKQHPRKRLERVSIRAEHHEEPDWDRFAWALLQHVRLISQEISKPTKRRSSPHRR